MAQDSTELIQLMRGPGDGLIAVIPMGCPSVLVGLAVDRSNAEYPEWVRGAVGESCSVVFVYRRKGNARSRTFVYDGRARKVKHD